MILSEVEHFMVEMGLFIMRCIALNDFKYQSEIATVKPSIAILIFPCILLIGDPLRWYGILLLCNTEKGQIIKCLFVLTVFFNF